MEWGETVFGGLKIFLAVSAVVFLCDLIYVLLGFGAGMVAVGTLAALLPEIRDVVVILFLLMFPAELWVVGRSRKQIAWRGIGTVLAGVALGVPLGAWALGTLATSWLLLGLGLFLTAAGVTFLLLPAGARVRWPRGVAPSVGLSAGFLSGLFGTAAPPLAVYFHLGPGDKTAFRGHMMAIFLAMTILKLPSYAAMGLFTGARLWSGVLLLPAAVLGAAAGQLLHVRIPEAAFRRAVAAGLLVLGALLLYRTAV